MVSARDPARDPGTSPTGAVTVPTRFRHGPWAPPACKKQVESTETWAGMTAKGPN